MAYDQPSWQSVIQQLNSNDNKALLWSLLSEEEVFSGLSEKSMQPVITLFETAIHTTINSYAQDFDKIKNMASYSSSSVLANLNKDVIKRVMNEISQYKVHSHAHTQGSLPSGIGNGGGGTGSGGLYKSADIQEARIKDITSKV
jgi:hypothetical protein